MNARSARMLKALAAALVVAAAVVAYLALPQVGAVPADVPLRFQVTYLNFVFSAYAAVLAVFLLLKVGSRPGAHELGVVLALMSLALALSVVPAEVPTLAHRVAFGVVWSGLVLQVIHFWTRFPHPMDLKAVAALTRDEARRMWYDGPNRRSAWMVRWSLDHHTGRILLVSCAVGFGWVLAGNEEVRYNFLVPHMDQGLAYTAVAGTVSGFIILVTALVAWTSYRISDERGRRQVLWAGMAHLITAFMAALALCLQVLAPLAGSPTLAGAHRGLMVAFQPVGWTVTLTGYALALFYSGAFDLRPLIGRSTVYGMTVILLTVMFAGVEELVQAQIASRVALPQGVGAWVAGGSIAIFLGPVHNRLQRVVRKLVPDLHASAHEEG